MFLYLMCGHVVREGFQLKSFAEVRSLFVLWYVCWVVSLIPSSLNSNIKMEWFPEIMSSFRDRDRLADTEPLKKLLTAVQDYSGMISEIIGG